jgi:hypothetical protein
VAGRLAQRRIAQSAIRGHAGNIRRYFLDSLTPELAATIRAWSAQVIDRIEPDRGDTVTEEPAIRGL